MKLSNVALLSTIALGCFVVTGCASKASSSNENDGSAAQAESEAVADNTEAGDTDDDLEGGVDAPVSGSSPDDPDSTPADAATTDDVVAKVKLNIGKFFKPAGCIATTWAGNVATHVFSDCTGPYGMTHFNGTITTTYDLSGGKLTITTQADGFKINGATISGSRVVTYTKSGTVITRVRTGNWSGTTKHGNPITHEANFTATYDTAAKCLTRDGTATTSIANRELDLSVTGYKRCGIGSLGCPESGKIVLSRTKNGNEISVTIDFLGGRQYSVTGPKGNTTTLSLVCRA